MWTWRKSNTLYTDGGNVKWYKHYRDLCGASMERKRKMQRTLRKKDAKDSKDRYKGL